jgi:glutamine amidotransferase
MAWFGEGDQAMIGIVDYGLGNISAFVNVYKRLNVPVAVARDAVTLRAAERLILPGVGAFDSAMTLLNQSGLRDALEERVCQDRIPVLGICVGMQMLANSSEEGKLAGLGWIEGCVRRFRPEQIHNNPLPHMGWNIVQPSVDELFHGIAPATRFYFLHSYYFECADQRNSIAVADYGTSFTCAVRKDNCHGVQFHPEKSHQGGIQLLRNFGSLFRAACAA